MEIGYGGIINEAKQALEETEYDKYLSDQEQMLDALYDETEEWINQRLDDQNWLLQQLIDYTNENASVIKDTLESEADAVGYELSEAMKSIWNPEGTYSSVVAGYVDGFTTLFTTTNRTLESIKEYVRQMGGFAEEEKEEAEKPVETPTPPVVETPSEQEEQTTTTNTTTPESSTGDGVPKVGDKVTFASGNYSLRSDGTGAEKGTKEFYSSTVAAIGRIDNFKPLDQTKYTIVIWIEGNDPDCIDELIGGTMKVDMSFNIIH